MTKTTLMFLGPCRKIDRRTGEAFRPFCERSRSGKFLRDMVAQTGVGSRARILFDNVLPHPFLNSAGVECNPDWKDLVDDLRAHHLWSLGTKDIVVGLSTVVSKALVAERDRRVSICAAPGPQLMFLAHPSFILRQKLPRREDYVREFEEAFSRAVASARV